MYNSLPVFMCLSQFWWSYWKWGCISSQDTALSFRSTFIPCKYIFSIKLNWISTCKLNVLNLIHDSKKTYKSKPFCELKMHIFVWAKMIKPHSCSHQVSTLAQFILTMEIWPLAQLSRTQSNSSYIFIGAYSSNPNCELT